MDRHAQALSLLHAGGVIPAVPLALAADGTFAPRWQRLLIRYYLEAGADGIAIAVHSTQFAIRSTQPPLFEPVIRVVAEELDRYEAESGRVVVRVCGVLGDGGQAVREAKLARQYGYDAVLPSPVGLCALSEPEVIRWIGEIAEIMPVIGFYLQPSVGGRVFSFSFWQALCTISNVVAIKCAPFNRYQTLQVLRAVALSPRAEAIALYTGNDDNLLLDLITPYAFPEDGNSHHIRFAGGLLGHWSIWTHTVVQQFAAWRRQREESMFPAALLTLAQEITDANAAVFDAANGFHGCIPGIHAVLARQGLLPSFRCLNPAETLSPGQPEEIDRVMRMYPHLTDDAFVKANLPVWKQKVGLL